jgi:subtilisin family serine protease
LAGAIEAMEDFTGSPHGPYDTLGHATHVAGIVGARSGNDRGIIGVAPRCKLIIAKGLGDDGVGYGRNIARAIYWCIDQRPHVINLSLGSHFRDDEIIEAMIVAVRKGIPVFCASGNDGDRGESWPGNHPMAISVGATTIDGEPAEFSSPSSVDVAGVGVEVVSLYHPGNVAVLSGTSMASPNVAGSFILYMQSAGLQSATHEEAIAALHGASRDVGIPGHDDKTGAGMVIPGDLVRERETANGNGWKGKTYNLFGLKINFPAKAGDRFGLA